MFYVGNVKAGGKPGSTWVRVDRGTPLGNPFHMGNESDRASVIEKYRVWLYSRITEHAPAVTQELQRLLHLEQEHGNLTLMCHCAPKPCHADILVKCLEWMKHS